MKKYQAYKQLELDFERLDQVDLTSLFENDASRFNKYSLELDGLFLDYSKNKIDDKAWNNLFSLAKEAKLSDRIEALFAGSKINYTENRAVLHTALRSNQTSLLVDNHNVMNDIALELSKMKKFADSIHAKEFLGYTNQPFTDIVNIGIGGSDLGPVFVTQALKPYRKNKLNIHFISSVDGYQVFDILENLNPETTLFIIASKTFTTQETLTNALTVREWFLDKTHNNINAISKHFVAASTNSKAVIDFGIDVKNMFQFWDFVGGRFSLWSAIGLSIMLYIGSSNFEELLLGAKSMDEHFKNTHDLSKNMPVILALIGIWHVNFCDYNTQVISPYNTRLTKFPSYIQQLEMESNGKYINNLGEKVDYNTCPVIFGDSGINGQHAYYQLLHQGTNIVPMDIILSLSDKYSNQHHNQILKSNAIAQAEAFMCGKTFIQAKQELLELGYEESRADFVAKNRVFTGNRPTNMICLNDITPYSLGQLIALYEHKVFVQGIIWQINSFDQWGVELGKQLAKAVLKDIETQTISKHDSSTTNLIKKAIQ